MPSDPQFTDSRGRPLSGRALDVAREARIRKLEEAERAARQARDEAEQARAITRRIRRRTARALVAAYGDEARRSGTTAPDLLRARLGADAEQILADAGVTAPPAVPQGPAQQKSSPWTDPEHDKAATDLLLGHVDAEGNLVPGSERAYQAKVAELRAQREQDREQARQQPAPMWRTRSGELLTDGMPAVIGASFGPSGAPVQQSMVHHDGSEQ
jgi:hypothetical protein